MKLTAEDIKNIIEYAEMAKELKPLAREIVDIITGFGPEVFDLLSAMSRGAVDLKIDMIRQYEKSGFTVEQAMYLVASDMDAIRKMQSTNKEIEK